MSETADVSTPSVAPAQTSDAAPDTPAPVAKKAAFPPDTQESIAQMKKTAQQRFDDAARMRKDIENLRAEIAKEKQAIETERAEMKQFVEMAKTNPRLLEKTYGKEAAKKIAEDLLYEYYQEEKLSPEEVELKNKRRKEAEELEELRKYRSERDAEEYKTKFEALKTEQAELIDTQIVAAINEYGLKPTPRVVKRIAEYLEAQLDTDVDMDPASVIPRVHEEIHQDVVGYIENMPDEQLLEEFPTLLKRVRALDMKRMADVPSFQSGVAAPQTEKKPSKPKQERTIDDFFRSIG